ncbi:MAG: hypothetical protein A2Y69_08070 [Candidatus Aminicenantes bacterium RBG_13_59_9]|nr:MAG: hypothetical protein A2Y69_08070 [Candidatus Aminicenantes bacterium RBG_13_59_9]
MKTARPNIKLIVLGLFALLTILHLAPLSFHPASALNDTQDCLLNTWIMAWDQGQLFRHPLKLFSANVFFPNQDPLRFSEHLFPQALASLPVRALGGSPVLAYNFVFFLGVLLNGYVMFLLVRHLVRDDAAAIIGGVIFAFGSYQMQHLAHVQLSSSWLIPMAFLYLLRFFEDKRLKNSVLFSLFFTLQALACVYYGLFFIAVLALAVPLLLLIHRNKIDRPFLARLTLPAIPALGVLLVFSLPYFSLFKSYGFRRELEKGADLAAYLAAWPRNIVWGDFLSPLGASESFLFPGLLTILLAAAAFLQGPGRPVKLIPRAWKYFFAVSVSAGLAITAISVLFSGIDLSLGQLRISIHNSSKPAFITLFSLLAFCLVLFIRALKEDPDGKTPIIALLGLVLFWALFLSFGEEPAFLNRSPFAGSIPVGAVSPFAWFYDLVPGFKGIRVPDRFAVFVLFSLAALAGFGAAAVFSRMTGRGAKSVLASALIVFLNVEFLTIPQKQVLVPAPRDIPPVYAWLKAQPGDQAIMEVPPFPSISNESIFMYFSLFHGKKLVNGYSGFLPPATIYIRDYFRTFPSWGCYDILKKLGVRHLVVHAGAWDPHRAEIVKDMLDTQSRTDLRPVTTFRSGFDKLGSLSRYFREDWIYEVIPPAGEGNPRRQESKIPAGRWAAKASLSLGLLPQIKDNDLGTGWTTIRGRKTDDYLLIEFSQPERPTRVALQLGNKPYDFAQDLKVAVSEDGNIWEVARKCYSPGEFALDLVRSPRSPVQTIYLDPKPVRFIKIAQVGNNRSQPWSVAEIDIFGIE